VEQPRALKGHGFSRGDQATKFAGFSRWVTCSMHPNHPSGAKAREFFWLFSGTAKAVPFQNN
jgi:hypothetical protein